MPVADSDEELIERCKKRMEVNDVCAINMVGDEYRNGFRGLRQSYNKGLELRFQAAKLRSIDAHILSLLHISMVMVLQKMRKGQYITGRLQRLEDMKHQGIILALQRVHRGKTNKQ